MSKDCKHKWITEKGFDGTKNDTRKICEICGFLHEVFKVQESLKTQTVIPGRCGNCFFSKDAGITRHDVKIVACRRFPPHQEGNQQTPGPYPFPMVNETEWCGEYKERKD